MIENLFGPPIVHIQIYSSPNPPWSPCVHAMFQKPDWQLNCLRLRFCGTGNSQQFLVCKGELSDVPHNDPILCRFALCIYCVCGVGYSTHAPIFCLLSCSCNLCVIHLLNKILTNTDKNQTINLPNIWFTKSWFNGR